MKKFSALLVIASLMSVGSIGCGGAEADKVESKKDPILSIDPTKNDSKGPIDGIWKRMTTMCTSGGYKSFQNMYYYIDNDMGRSVIEYDKFTISIPVKFSYGSGNKVTVSRDIGPLYCYGSDVTACKGYIVSDNLNSSFSYSVNDSGIEINYSGNAGEIDFLCKSAVGSKIEASLIPTL